MDLENISKENIVKDCKKIVIKIGSSTITS